jgi:hypothetical protein
MKLRRLPHRRVRGIHRLQRHPCGYEEAFALWSERHLAGRTVKERRLQSRLELLHPSTRASLRQAQIAASRGDGAAFGHANEQFHQSQTIHAPTACRSYRAGD